MGVDSAHARYLGLNMRVLYVQWYFIAKINVMNVTHAMKYAVKKYISWVYCKVPCFKNVAGLHSFY